MLAKVLPVFVYPLGFAILLVLLGALVAGVWRRAARVLLIMAVVVLWGASMPYLSNRFLDPVEQRHPRLAVGEVPKADAIVILGGGIGDFLYSHKRLNLEAAIDRLYHGNQLYTAGKAPLIVVTGGAEPGKMAEADVMALLLEEWGVPKDRILVERESRNTFENAIYSRELLGERGVNKVLLVTSAFHMRRAVAVFRSQAIDAFPVATDFQADLSESEYPLLEWLPDAEALYSTTKVIKEFIGFEYYRWKGWIKE